MVASLHSVAHSSHLLVTHPSASTALELLLLETCANSQHASIQMQFTFQNYLSQFSSTPNTERFRACQDMFNRILRAQTGTIDTRFREHIGPAVVVVGAIMGTRALPSIIELSAEVAERQARRDRVFEEEVEPRQTLHKSRSMNLRTPTPPSPGLKGEPTMRATSSGSFDLRRPTSSTYRASTLSGLMQHSSSVTHLSNKHSGLMSQSQPNLQPPPTSPQRLSPLRPVSPAVFTDENITRTLQSHYYSTQTQFLQCLQDISLRLRLVPKVARQSALRIELAALDKWLPADVCLVKLCRSNDVHDRIVQIVQADCTILNSAERVCPSISDAHSRSHIYYWWKY